MAVQISGDRSPVHVPPRRPGESAYRVLAQALRDAIRQQRFGDDQPLPTELSLAEEHGLSRQTVRRAYQDLVAEGLVYRVPGRGTFVTARDHRYGRSFASVEDLMNLTLDTELEVVSPLVGGYDASAAVRLGLETKHLYLTSFRRLHRGEAFCLTHVYVPSRTGQQLEHLPEVSEVGRRSKVTVIGLLEARGNDIASAEQVISAVAAKRAQHLALGCALGSPLLHIERVYFDPRGEPLEVAVSDYLPEHYSHRMRLGRGSGVHD
jgi:DNA-binding GntR family transcriptional regulator